MKALTLHQPWAHLVAIGAKQFETRSWRTNYRGLLAICSSQNMGASDPVLHNHRRRTPRYRPPFDRYLKPSWDWLYGTLAYGCVTAVVEVVGCYPADQVARSLHHQAIREPASFRPIQEELAFGDFSPGRWAWSLRPVVDLSEAGFGVRGRQGLFNLTPEEDLRLFAICAGCGVYLSPSTKLLEVA